MVKAYYVKGLKKHFQMCSSTMPHDYRGMLNHCLNDKLLRHYNIIDT